MNAKEKFFMDNMLSVKDFVLRELSSEPGLSTNKYAYLVGAIESQVSMVLAQAMHKSIDEVRFSFFDS